MEKLDRRSLIQAIWVGGALAPILSLDSVFALQGVPVSQSASPTKISRMDPNVSFARQIERNADSVVLLSTFLVRPEHVDDFLAGFQKQFGIMRKQPGLISAQLHHGIAGSCLFMNYVVWESTDASKRGYELPEFQAQLKQYPPGTEVSAFFFHRVAVPGMCLSEPMTGRKDGATRYPKKKSMDTDRDLQATTASTLCASRNLHSALNQRKATLLHPDRLVSAPSVSAS